MSRILTKTQTPEEAFRNMLLTDARVARLLGMNIYAILSPGSRTLPFAAFSRQTVDRNGTLASGPLRSSVVTVSLTVYAATYEEAREIANAVREKVDGFVGEAYGLDIGGIQMTSESDDYVSLGGEQLATAYTVEMSFTIRWREVG